MPATVKMFILQFRATAEALLHSACVVDDTKCILVTRVCLSPHSHTAARI